MYPTMAEIDGVTYPINTDYRVAIKCFDVINDEDIGDFERTFAVIYLLFGFVPDKNLDKFLEKATLFLKCGKKGDDGDVVKDIDFSYDAGYIMASFMSDYNIDLSKADLHFWQYIDLVGGLTKHCILNRVREIRNYDLSEIKDEKSRSEMAAAKKALALPVKLTKEEQETIDRFNALFEGVSE